ncbi:MAG: DUF1120 domain-containing protein [Serratia proteamaculans]|uniref:DUF1120 domain-containing protein n=1 Tax=Serratia proteamaculans TaxID=28151 RepID=UPI000EE5AF49|nr:hypothetical protein [Serratia sp. (in: enterobacteria)]
MKKTLLVAALATAVTYSTSSAFAADTVDLKIGGSITQSACTPTLSDGGSLDYGDIKVDTLKTDGYTVLPVKTLDFSITCIAPTKVGLSATNNRIGSLAGSTEKGNGAGFKPVPLSVESSVFGLGMAGTKKIGGYGIDTANGTSGGRVVDALYRKLNNQWNPYVTGGTPGGYLFDSGMGDTKLLVTWGSASIGGIFPGTFKTVSCTLNVQAYINKASELDITQPIKMDGSATLELVYL